MADFFSQSRATRPMVLAHRGASAHFVENSLEAFEAAASAGADGFELDVQLSSDGEAMVFHDYDLDRLCGQRGKVFAHTKQELQSMTLMQSQKKIPTLQEVLLGFPKLSINVELKKQSLRRTLPLAKAVCQKIADCGHQQILLSSFDPRILALCAQMAPSIPRALLFHEEQGSLLRSGLLAKVLGAQAVHPQHTLLHPVAVKRWQSHGFRVHTWTVDSPERIARLVDMGVDAIICNDPKSVLAQLEG